MIGSLRVLLTGGATVGNLTLSNPLLNAAGNTVTIAPGAAVISVDGSAQVKQGL
jgi:hypothetical protein